MSTDASADTRDGSPSSTTNYDAMLDDLDAAIHEAREKVESGRVYDAENEKVRQGWVRALAYAVNVRRQVANDRDLEALAERVERLEADQGVGT
jgi:hypothetical protein